MISRTGRYALNILGHLASRPDERVSGKELARLSGVPANYLSKIMNQLRKQGIVVAEKGWGGGFQLRPEALQLPIREILVLIEGAGSVDRVDCLFGFSRCNAEDPCPLHPYWERIRNIYNEMLKEVRVADLIA